MSDPLDRSLMRYRKAPLRDRWHMAIRRRLCPFPRILEQVPRSGRVLEVGCGHGLFTWALALHAPDREVLGVDIDERKIALARDALEQTPCSNLSFGISGTNILVDGPWDCIVLVDVLYLLSTKAQRALLETLVAALAPDGLLLIKEMALEPRWKFRWARFQEVLAVHLLRITEGDDIELTSPTTTRAWLETAGLETSGTSLDQGYMHPHYLIRARRQTVKPR